MLLELMATTCTFVGVPEGAAVIEEVIEYLEHLLVDSCAHTN